MIDTGKSSYELKNRQELEMEELQRVGELKEREEPKGLESRRNCENRT